MLAKHPTSAVRGLLALLSVVVGFALALGAGRPAEAAGPCWKRLLDDWYDGRIEASYPQACYRSAIRHLPPDVVLYSNAEEEITAALRQRVLSSTTGGRAVQAGKRRTIPAKRALASLGPRNATSPPIAVMAVAAVALLLIACGVWQGLRNRRA